MILGLTGGIASGKTTVAQHLVKLGAQLIEADDIGRQVVEPGCVGLVRVVEAFGPEVLAKDGTLKRQVLGSIVFGDKEKLALLNSILHPLMEEEMEKQIQELSTKGHVVLSAAILFEAGWERLVEKVIVTSVDEKTQVARLMDRDGLTREEAQRRIDSQLPLQQKMLRADYLIDTSLPFADVKKQVEKIWREIL
jgi:dephospho-CoA kinase